MVVHFPLVKSTILTVYCYLGLIVFSYLHSIVLVNVDVALRFILIIIIIGLQLQSNSFKKQVLVKHAIQLFSGLHFLF